MTNHETVTHDWADDLSDNLFSHGSEERQRNFVLSMTHLMKNISGCPKLDSLSTFQLLAEVALEWPGDENDEWAVLTGLAAYFFKEAVDKGEINPEQLLNSIGNA